MFDKYLDNLRERGKPEIDKYRFWRLILFVAMPLPLTGVYTGTILAWLLDMDCKKVSLAVGLDVIVTGVVVFLITLGVTSIQ